MGGVPLFLLLPVGMTAARTPLDQLPQWPGLQASGLVVALGATLVLTPATRGGLAPLAASAVMALLLAAPLAGARNRSQADQTGPAWVVGVDHALRDALPILLVAALLATLTAPLGLAGGVAAVAVWPLALVTPVRGRALALLGLLALALLAAGAALAAPTGAPWGLLEPGWGAWRLWIGPALTLGVLLGGPTTGPWAWPERRLPGSGRAPWLAVGLGLAAALLALLRAGSLREAALGTPAADPLVVAAAALALVAAGRVACETPSGRLRALHAGTGTVATLYLVGPGAGALPFFWTLLLPLALIGQLGLVAVRAPSAGRWPAMAGAVALAAAVLVGGPEVPRGALDACAAAGIGVALFWLVGTRAVLARSPS